MILADERLDFDQSRYNMYYSFSGAGKTALNNLPDHSQAGKPFFNIDKKLPVFDANGNKIRYNEFDAYPFGSDPGKEFNGMITRGQSRFIRDDFGNVYFTNNHHESYRLITMQ